MIQALLRGKLSRDQENMEDILTSCVFGMLSYLPPDVGLIPFLSASEPVCGTAPALEGPAAQVSYRFWPQLAEQRSAAADSADCLPCEPDVLLELRKSDGRLVYVLVEAKLWSGKSSWASEDYEAPRDQLAREWDNLARLSAREGAEPLLVYLTADFSAPLEEIRQSREEYLQKRPGGAFACAWLSWRAIPRLFGQSDIDQLQDLVKLCERLNLRYFTRSARFEAAPDVTWRFRTAGPEFRWLREPVQAFQWRYRG
ncbi:MAG: hypothetical protein ACFCUT_04445 [Kiloniellaceae bacterium]